jgi:hypothetical protein
MSSRSFRRRNNRRRHRTGPGGETQESRIEGAPVPQPGDAEGRPSLPADPSQPREPRGDGNQRRDPSPRGERSQRRSAQQRESQRPGGQRRSGRQAARGPAPRGPAEEAAVRPAVPLVVPDCPICGKPVRELASALTHRLSRQPAHFDCIVKELRESNEIAPQEKLCYLGGGCFGILEFRPPGGPSRFVIKRRIQYEEKEFPQDWKKPLQVSC